MLELVASVTLLMVFVVARTLMASSSPAAILAYKSFKGFDESRWSCIYQ